MSLLGLLSDWNALPPQTTLVAGAKFRVRISWSSPIIAFSLGGGLSTEQFHEFMNGDTVVSIDWVEDKFTELIPGTADAYYHCTLVTSTTAGAIVDYLDAKWQEANANEKVMSWGETVYQPEIVASAGFLSGDGTGPGPLSEIASIASSISIVVVILVVLYLYRSYTNK